MSIHIRAFLRAIASDEPVYHMAHPSITHIFAHFDRQTYDNNNNKDLISYHSPLVYKLVKFCKEKGLLLPDSFYQLVQSLGTLAESMVTQK